MISSDLPRSRLSSSSDLVRPRPTSSDLRRAGPGGQGGQALGVRARHGPGGEGRRQDGRRRHARGGGAAARVTCRSTPPEDSAPSASLAHLKAQAAPPVEERPLATSCHTTRSGAAPTRSSGRRRRPACTRSRWHGSRRAATSGGGWPRRTLACARSRPCPSCPRPTPSRSWGSSRRRSWRHRPRPLSARVVTPPDGLAAAPSRGDGAQGGATAHRRVLSLASISNRFQLCYYVVHNKYS